MEPEKYDDCFTEFDPELRAALAFQMDVLIDEYLVQSREEGTTVNAFDFVLYCYQLLKEHPKGQESLARVQEAIERGRRLAMSGICNNYSNGHPGGKLHYRSDECVQFRVQEAQPWA